MVNVRFDSDMPILLLLLLVLPSPGSTASPLYNICEDDGQYTPNTSFDSNLKLLLSSLTSNTSSRFITSFIGELPSIAYGLAICPPDIPTSSCHSCLATAADALPDLCSLYYRAVIWFEDCELRYSNIRFFSTVDNGVIPCIPNSNRLGVADPGRFDAAVSDLMVRISDKASRSPDLFGTGKVNSSGGYPAIYGMAMCTKDLSEELCGDCLMQIRIQIQPCLEGKEGGQVLGKSCNLRYDVRGFFTEKPDIVLAYGSSSPPMAGAPQVPPAREGNKSKMGKLLGSVISLVVVTLLGISICLCLLRRKLRSAANKVPNISGFEEISNVESILFDLSILRGATDNFSDKNKLGQGGFGAVYRGTLPGGQEIAVKRLSAGSKQGMGELKNELVLVAKLRHKNLVRILGVCLEGSEKLLVYEFVPNGSLHTFIFDTVKRKHVQWHLRQKIINGIARGLLYLHEESQLRIIHRDLKPSNILLDADMNPKISDFGLARLCGGEQTHGTTRRIVGTFGYMAPEYVMHGRVSFKCDVYSYGVLVLEIITGRNSSSFDHPEHDDLLSYIWRHWTNGTVLEIVDPYLNENWSRSEVFRCVQIGLLCVHEDPGARPNMSSVFAMLHSHSMALQAPSSPAFFLGANKSVSNRLQETIKFNASDGGGGGSQYANSILDSSNIVSITELSPR